MTSTPASLLERLRRPNDPAAWGRFVELYTPVLFTWARRLGLQEPDAADLVQEVFTLLVNKLPAFVYDPSKGFRGWLRTVALNQYRAGLRRRRVDALDPAGLDGVEAPAAEAFWEEEYRRHLVGRALAVMQAEFQPATWQACWETVVNGRAAGEVGAALGLSPGAVRVAKFRVLARLRQELAGMVE